MARFCRGQSRRVTFLQIVLLALMLAALASLHAKAQTLYERPVLIVDPDMHTARSRRTRRSKTTSTAGPRRRSRARVKSPKRPATPMPPTFIGRQ